MSENVSGTMLLVPFRKNPVPLGPGVRPYDSEARDRGELRVARALRQRQNYWQTQWIKQGNCLPNFVCSNLASWGHWTLVYSDGRRRDWLRHPGLRSWRPLRTVRSAKSFKYGNITNIKAFGLPLRIPKINQAVFKTVHPKCNCRFCVFQKTSTNTERCLGSSKTSQGKCLCLMSQGYSVLVTQHFMVWYIKDVVVE